MATYTLIHRSGNREEVPFLLVGDKEYVSAHISRREFGQRDGSYAVVIFDPLKHLFEAAREKVGRPILISSGYRSAEYQRKLYEEDVRQNGGRPSGKVAKPGNSPHELGAAMDLIIPAGWTAEELAKLFRDTSVALGFPVARTGWKRYLGQGFIHVDLAPMLFKPYTDVPNPRPQLWIPGLVW